MVKGDDIVLLMDIDDIHDHIYVVEIWPNRTFSCRASNLCLSGYSSYGRQ